MFRQRQPNNVERRLSDSMRQTHKAVFDNVYTPDGYEHRLVTYIVDMSALDAGIEEFNRRMGSLDEARRPERETIAHPITRFTSFVGLPNYCPVGQPQSWANIWNNLIGWQPDVTEGREIFNGLLAPFVLTKNLLFVIPLCARNIIRLATEYLPALGLKYFQGAVIFCKKIFFESEWKPLSNATYLKYRVLYALATLGAVVFGSLHFVGQAVTSPIAGVRSAWKLGHDMMFKVKNPTTKKVLGTMAAFLFSALSMAVTATVYTLLFPLAIHAIGGLIAGQSIPVISAAVSAVTTAAPAWFTAVGNTVVMPVLGKVFTAIGAAVSPAAAGVGFLAGAGLTTVGLAVSKGYYALKNKFRSTAKATPVQGAEVQRSSLVLDEGSTTRRLSDAMPPVSGPAPVPAPAQKAAPKSTSAGNSKTSTKPVPIPTPASSGEVSPPVTRRL